METTYVYQKERREFGRQCLFSDKNELLFSEATNRDLSKEFINRNPVSTGTQLGRQMAASEMNTETAEYESHGVNHTEGGWPKDVNYLDPEQTVRYKRKIEKDESYLTQVLNLTKPMEHVIFQNNAVNIYENYFEDLEPAPLAERCKSRTVNVFRDPAEIRRPVTHLSWSPDGGTKIAATYCNRDFLSDRSQLSANSYIWEISNPNAPLYTLAPPTAAICTEYNPKDSNCLVSGMFNGQVAAWDTRYGNEPTMMSEREIGHRDTVGSVLWINSKSGTEFFSGSSDGQVIWWDTRKLNEPLDKLLMDPIKTDDQDLDRSYGVSILEYETTIPTRFMCGTEQGMIFSCNRKGKTPIEKITQRMQCHSGPIYSLSRNPAFVKNYLTVGDWIARIWSEDCRESSVIWTKNHSYMLTDGCWSNTKGSMFFISRMDGVMDAWDLLQQQNEPVLAVKVCDEPLQCIRNHEGGKLIGAGSAKGIIYLLEVSDNMAISAKNDKPLLTAMLERESRRERILEAKSREIKLKSKTAQKVAPVQHHDEDDSGKPKLTADQIACITSEDEYKEGLAKEQKLRVPDEIEEKPLPVTNGLKINESPENEPDDKVADSEVESIEKEGNEEEKNSEEKMKPDEKEIIK